MITKQIFIYYNTNFLLEITSKVNQKYTFTHKLTTKRNFQTPSLFFSSTGTEWNAQDCGISKTVKDTSMLPSKIDQKKASHETGSEANFGFGRALMPSYLGMLPTKAVFFSFWMQPMFSWFQTFLFFCFPGTTFCTRVPSGFEYEWNIAWECLALSSYRVILGTNKTSGHAHTILSLNFNLYLFTPALENLYANTLARKSVGDEFTWY